MTTDIHWTSAGDTHAGNVRPANEDGFLADSARGLWLVADGVGGHSRGDIASRMICEAVMATELPDTLDPAVAALSTALDVVNDRLVARRDGDPRHRTSGSTFAALLVRGEDAAVIWVGDSRVYRLRESHLQQLTHDHSRVAEMVDAGLISEAEAERHPEANIITRAVGADSTLKIDNRVFGVAAGDRFLLCTDGLYREVSADAMARQLADGDQPESITGGLMNRALSGQARDNVTAITVLVNLAPKL